MEDNPFVAAAARAKENNVTEKLSSTSVATEQLGDGSPSLWEGKGLFRCKAGKTLPLDVLDPKASGVGTSSISALDIGANSSDDDGDGENSLAAAGRRGYPVEAPKKLLIGGKYSKVSTGWLQQWRLFCRLRTSFLFDIVSSGQILATTAALAELGARAQAAERPPFRCLGPLNIQGLVWKRHMRALGVCVIMA